MLSGAIFILPESFLQLTRVEASAYTHHSGGVLAHLSFNKGWGWACGSTAPGPQAKDRNPQTCPATLYSWGRWPQQAASRAGTRAQVLFLDVHALFFMTHRFSPQLGWNLVPSPR